MVYFILFLSILNVGISFIILTIDDKIEKTIKDNKDFYEMLNMIESINIILKKEIVKKENKNGTNKMSKTRRNRN